MKSLVVLIMIISALLLGTAHGAGGERTGRPVATQIVLPAAVEGYTWNGSTETFDATTVFGYINGAAELYLAYGFSGLTVRRFEKPGLPSIILEVYELASSEDAYGVFSFERQDAPAGIGQGSEFGGGLLRFWKGNVFASVYAEGEGQGVDAAILGIGKATAEVIPVTGSEPRLIQFLPGDELGLVEGSTRYLKSHVLLNQRFFIAHENILNLSRRTEAALAAYSQRGQRVHVLLIRYPTAEESGKSLGRFQAAYMPDAAGRDRVRTEDGKWTVARQRTDYLLLVFGAPTEYDADALLKAAEERLGNGRR